MKKEESPRHANRRQSLESLVREIGSATELAALVGTPKSHISALLAGKRGIGDALAAKIEKKCGKPLGWMDEANFDFFPHPEHHPGVSTQTTDEADLLLSFRSFPAPIQQELVRDFMRLALNYQSAEAAAVFKKYNLTETAAAERVAENIAPKPSDPPVRDHQAAAVKAATAALGPEKRETLIKPGEKPAHKSARRKDVAK